MIIVTRGLPSEVKTNIEGLNEAPLLLSLRNLETYKETSHLITGVEIGERFTTFEIEVNDQAEKDETIGAFKAKVGDYYYKIYQGETGSFKPAGNELKNGILKILDNE